VTVRGGVRREGTASTTPAPTETGRPRPAGLIHKVDREDLSLVRFHVTVPDTPDIRFLTADFTLRDRDNNVLTTGHREELQLKPGNNVLSFPVSNIPAGEYFADLWIKRDGAVLGFGSQALRVTGKTRIKAVRLASEYFGKDDAITGVVEIEGGNLPAAGWSAFGGKLGIRQTDNHGRLVRQSSFNIRKSTFNIALPPVPDPLTVYQFLDIELVSGGTVFDRRRVSFTLSNVYLEDTIRVHCWQVPRPSYLSFHTHAQLYRAGFESCYVPHSHDHPKHDYFGVGPNSTFKRGRPEIAVLSNLHYMPSCARITDVGHHRGTNIKVFLGSSSTGEDPLKLDGDVRYPCVNDPKYRELMRKRVAEVVDYHGRLSSSDYIFDQEMTFTSFWARKDGGEVCFCPYCRKYFQDYLRKEYGSIEAVNAEYGTGHKSFDSIEPVKLADATQDPKLRPLWADFRMAMDSSYSGLYEMMTEAVHAIQPDARTGDNYSCFTGFRSFGAADMWKMSRWMTAWAPKPNYFNELRMDFARPGSLMGWEHFWAGASRRSKEHSTITPWRHLLKGANFFDTYWCDGGSLPARDLSLYPDLKVLIEQFREIKGGIGKLIHESRRDTGGVAVLYSIASIHHWVLTEGSMSLRDGIQGIYNAWMALLADARGPFRFISYEQLAEGILSKGDFELLVLPCSQALSPDEVEQIKAFARNGGTVLADYRPGVSDGHCKPYEEAPLDDVFGVVQDTRPQELQRARIGLSVAGVDGPRRFGRLLTDLSLKTADGSAGAVAGDNVPALISHQYGKGKGILLNFVLSDYLHPYQYARKRSMNAPKILAVMKPVISDAMSHRPVTISPELPGLNYYLSHSGAIEYLGLLQELPEHGLKYAAGTAAPLVSRRVTVSCRAARHIYDARAGRYLGCSDTITAHIKPGIARVFSLMPYRVTGISLTAPAAVNQGDALRYKVSIAATVAPGKHVLNVSLSDPQGRAIRWYTKNVTCTGGTYAGELALALNEKPGTYELSVTDAATGVAGRAGLEVMPRGL